MKSFFLAFLLTLSAAMGAQTFSPERTGGVYFAYPWETGADGATGTTGTSGATGATGTYEATGTFGATELGETRFQPFYISHYGRHGSRWLPSEERYTWVWSQFKDKSRLTPFGKSVRSRLKKICSNARGNAGALTPLGAKQHRGIARRMVQRFPEVFSHGLTRTNTDGNGHGLSRTDTDEDIRILARSSTSPRCRASMLAFCEELKSLTSHPSPPTSFTIETNPAHMAYINNESEELKALTARTKVPINVSTDRFLSALFKNPSDISQEDAMKLLSELHTIASDMQDIPLDISLWDCFTQEEMLAVHDANNERMTICNGDTIVNDGIPARSSIALWQNIVAEADSMIASGGHGASLRFGHDTALFRLLTLIGLQLPSKNMEDIIPMAANLQIIFGHGLTRTDTDGVFVIFLLNERPCTLKSVKVRESPWQKKELSEAVRESPWQNKEISEAVRESPWLYSWTEVKETVAQRIHDLEHQRQLTALNTMVGTAPANTQSAGLFGKGSEEHGQTLPAVLVPNGQTFWTPQTRDTEQKCVAPYYYQDSLFQGIRASHWLVGGCTQDYGSFTVRVAPSNLPQLGEASNAEKSGTALASPNWGRLEGAISYPHYYAITLPHEQVRLELTGLSHSAMLRVTPLADGPLTIAIEANSDEQEGHVTIDGEQQEIYGYNPVHRIYQGWGEPAGFSGHFVLRYDEDPIALEEIGQAVSLTFDAKKGHSIVLRMATSFTSREGAERNLQAEAASISFEQMEQRCMNQWIKRLHTIDIDDPDTARINQLYGALYRASFLPREMSDCDGSYPIFGMAPSHLPQLGEASNAEKSDAALTSPSWGRLEGVVRYGDFSLWDTYRALHPLLCIIAPEESAAMMQSLVGMAQEGGWMPIFPCWNSYTAAMIGDHAASVIADAYVKGIRDFDASTAYAYLRKNAFEKPTTFEEYKNGMGRRALDSYLKYGYIPLEDSVKEAFHQQEQTSRTLEYAYDDFCVAQLAKRLLSDGRLVLSDFSLEEDYAELMRRSENWRNVINPKTGWADGRFAAKEKKKLSPFRGIKGGSWLGNTDLTSRQPYITEGAVCHYTWYVPQNVNGLITLMGGREAFTARLDSMFSEGRYWHGNEPCHQIAWLYSLAGQPEKTRQQVTRILQTEYNDTPGGLSGNDDAGQMSAWQIFANLGFYPVCPGTPQYVLGGAQFQQVTLNQPGRVPFVIRQSTDNQYRLNGQLLDKPILMHDELLRGGVLDLPSSF